ncbi:enoyl-CoA hydratase/isomerase family protein [Nocardioides daejeonensis]|uniref:enoyl-CoA hydratase/isomerase family protein n=1 Tax=Nocardioides daejeonensis TaxID=1046556 RepID=UPI000D7417A0|nr:enoyl-CoA hydratase/isomerase family protein [Nocardioides daejeonensis]
MSTTLSRERGDRVAVVRYDNAARGNSFGLAQLDELATTLERAAARPECAVVRLDMAGRHFCGGWDTSSFASLAASGTDAVAASLRTSDELLARIRDLPVPVVAGVRGKVIGFGVGLLAALHLSIAADDVELSMPEVGFGFAPAGVGHLIAQALPRAQAYALLTHGTADAKQLASWGLVSRVVHGGDLDQQVDGLVETLARIPAGTLRAVVEVVESSRVTGRPDRAYEIAARTVTTALTQGDTR